MGAASGPCPVSFVDSGLHEARGVWVEPGRHTRRAWWETILSVGPHAPCSRPRVSRLGDWVSGGCPRGVKTTRRTRGPMARLRMGSRVDAPGGIGVRRSACHGYSIRHRDSSELTVIGGKTPALSPPVPPSWPRVGWPFELPTRDAPAWPRVPAARPAIVTTALAHRAQVLSSPAGPLVARHRPHSSLGIPWIAGAKPTAVEREPLEPSRWRSG